MLPRLISPFLSIVAVALLAPPIVRAAPQGKFSGNAATLRAVRLPTTLSSKLQAHNNFIFQRAKLQRLHHQNKLLTMSTASGMELSEVKGKVSFNVTGGTVSSESTLTIKSLSGQVSTLYLYMEPLTGSTDQVTDSEGTLQTSDLGQDVLQVTLSKPLNTGESVVLTVKRAGEPQCKSSFLNLVTCHISPNMIFNIGAAWQPMVYDVYTYEGVIPKKASLEVTVPGTMTAAASGLAVSKMANPDGTKTFTFTNDYKGTFSIAASDYSYGSTFFSGAKVAGTYLFSAAAQPHAEGWQEAIAEIMEFYEQRFGPYDPPSIHAVEITNITAAAFGPFLTVFMPTATLAYDPKMVGSKATLAHELGHQWFAGMIETADSYSPWLAEGFASFAEMEHSSAEVTKEYGIEYGPVYRRRLNQEYIYMVPPALDVPMTSKQIYEVPAETYFIVTYTKGALVVDMLRYLVGGDTPFFKAMKIFRDDHKNKGVTVSSLLASMNKASGKELKYFLDSWVYKVGYPTYAVEVKRSGSDGKHRLELVLTADKDFHLPVEVELITADGKPVRRLLPHKSPGTKFELTEETASEVLQVRVDPDAHIVGRKHGALFGDIQLNGAVDGIDLIYAAMAMGQQYEPYGTSTTGGFADWADLKLDGQIDQQDLDLVTHNFGKRTGDKQ